MLGLYIHIPFCKSICHYCNFYKMVVSDNLKEKTIDYIIKELMLVKQNELLNVETIYLGGGTPSSLPLKLLEKLLSTLVREFEIEKVREFTIEANPEDLTEEFIVLISKYHINRVSIGVQSFNKKTIDFLGRKTFVTFEEMNNKVKLLNKYGIKNVSLDLIYAVPNQTIDELKDDINKLVKLPITHISTYSFMLEERTILKHKYDKSEFNLIDEDIDALMYQTIYESLAKYGFNHYETSNFAKDGFNGLHNLNYWKHGQFIGIGPAGASYYNNKRYCNLYNLNKYFECVDNDKFEYEYVEEIDFEQSMEDEIMLGLRLLEGVDLIGFKSKFNKDLLEEFPSSKKLINNGLLIIQNNKLSIPEKYAYIANYVISNLIFKG